MEVKLDTKQVDAWIKNNAYRDRAQRMVAVVITNQATSNLKSRSVSTSASGTLSNSTYGTVDSQSNQYTARVFAGTKYAEVAWETGRKPGRMPPVDALRRWAALKLGDPNLAYAVAKKIAKSGTNSYKRGGNMYITKTAEWIKDFLYPKLLPKLLDDFTK